MDINNNNIFLKEKEFEDLLQKQYQLICKQNDTLNKSLDTIENIVKESNKSKFKVFVGSMITMTIILLFL